MKLRKILPRLTSLLVVAMLAVTLLAQTPTNKVKAEYLPQEQISKVDYSVDLNVESYLDQNVVTKLPETVSDNDDISVIVEMNVDSVLDKHQRENSSLSVFEYANSVDGRKAVNAINKQKSKLLNMIKRSGVKYSLGESYETLFGGFEVTIKAKDFDKLNDLLSSYGTLMVGEVYNPCESVVVENVVDVYETGIFDSSNCEYQGDGVVVAVLDTGLDYTHTAFSVDNFTTEVEKFTLESVSKVVDDLSAATTTRGLTGEDVYLNSKVPYAYDYGDKDPDVLPINSEHGTHVAGVIAGKDDTIVGVAPNAQLAVMKVFSDTQTGAKTSWILAALEDCVVLGVDVINMSLGTSCGFTREVDRENINVIYDKIHEQGISLICAASNDGNATQGSDKNGSNGLTSNPDSGTVGSPSTYEASLSVASVDGVKTPYLVHEGDIIYFNEASTNDAETKKNFVDDVLKQVGSVDSYEFTYVTIPGIGKSSDYAESPEYYKDKIVLVKRGQSTFEDKVRIALKEKGAAGIIIYNNVSGTISMAVGDDIGAVCSISQDEGEKLAKTPTGKILISRNNTAGPFMSDFSSWGPTSDLRIKPEITAHGGEILSAVPGQGYERLSGTSMAAPNQAGAAALIRQYVIYSGVFGNDLTGTEINSLVNRLMMSTADIVINKNGLPYAVRKQGAGLININDATTTASYITTYDSEGNEMDKAKLELGDDKQKTGVYEMTFGITNISSSNVSYSIDAQLITEGVSSTYTGHDDQTVTQEGYLLEGTSIQVTNVENGSLSGNTVTVGNGQTAKVSVKIVLSEEDKQYINDSFENGMYVEGFITLDAQSGTEVDMNVPMLAFFGDWTQAPIFDEEYYDTHKDEINAGLDENDKVMADAYATRVIGGLYSDYITTLGSYYFVQNPSSIQIAASKEHIALSNQTGEDNWTVNTIRSINAGFLRNVKEVNITITEEATGRVIFERTEYNQMKSHSAGLTIYPSSIDTEFSVLEHNLKNNTKYNVKVEAYIDYGNKEDQKNLRNVFEFPFYVDFEAPVVEDVVYRTEYDRTTKETKLFADIYLYDNHYAMGMQVGAINLSEDNRFMYSTFDKYITPVYSTFNSTSLVTVDLTDHISKIKNASGIRYLADGSSEIVHNINSFVVSCYDYAMNQAMYEIKLPDEIASMYFEQDQIRLSPNETLKLDTVLNVYPSTSWMQVLDFRTSDDNICDVVNQTLLAKQSGTATITAVGKDADGNTVTTSCEVIVLAEGDEGFVPNYTLPEVNKFTLTGYKTEKAFYGVSSDEREIGLTGNENSFGDTYSLSMYPSESVTLRYEVDSYYPENTGVTFRIGNQRIATVDEKGTITALEEGTTNLMVTITFDGKPTLFSQRVVITVKDPYTINAIYLNSYKGLGGEVVIPDDRGITTIYDYAFSNYEYVDKDPAAGDIIDEEDPYLIKQQFIGEDTITKVVIPEGVTDINSYAFAGLTALEEVVLPKSLTRIGVGAFYGCTKLSKINLENVKFINERAFYNCNLADIKLSSVVSIGNYSFENCKLNSLSLPLTSQSLGIGAFTNNDYLVDVFFAADKIKIGANAFAGCDMLESININAVVVSSYSFADCPKLENVTLGKDVAVIGQYAFAGTNVSKFTVSPLNTQLTTGNGGAIIYKGTELMLVAPQYGGVANTITTDATSIAVGAFAGNVKVFKVVANNVTKIANYAFAQCTNLREVSLQSATEIGDYAFFGDTNLQVLPSLANVKSIGKYAFYATSIKQVTIPDGCLVDNYAFSLMKKLETVTIGNDVTINEGAFYCPMVDLTYEATGNFNNYTQYTYEVTDADGNVIETYDYYRYTPTAGSVSVLNTVTIGENAKIGFAAFAGNLKLSSLTLGQGTVIGERAFFNDSNLQTVDLSGVVSIGEYAFSGATIDDYWLYKGLWRPAYEREYIDGEVVITGYMYASYAPQITTLNLEGVSDVGRGAFAFNDSLVSVTLNPAMTSISAELFAQCTNLKDVVLPDGVTEVGNYAFLKTAITSIDLSNVTTIGESSFARTALKQVTLSQNPTTVGDGAFANCYNLTQITGVENLTNIGSLAFTNTKITNANLQNAQVIGDGAFANSKVTTVTLPQTLESLGENPFSNCQIATFGREEEVIFGENVVGTTLQENYQVSQNVMVFDGVLYQMLPNGEYELVSFPMASTLTSYTVKEQTARISARAFAGSSLVNVTLPTTLDSIGHMAFYGMEKLSTVTFLSYNAPILEEEYDESHLTYENLPLSGIFAGYEGLGIVDYYMWNITGNFNNFYFGANFVDYIGHVKQNLTMVAPSNGQYYNTFIFKQYFNNFVSGSPAKQQVTEEVIKLIDTIPQSVTLNDEQLIVSIRAKYNGLPSLEQQSLVSNYEKLTSAEAVIQYLKQQQSGQVKPETPDVETPGNSLTIGVMVTILILCILCAVTTTICLFLIFANVKNKPKTRKVDKVKDFAESQPSTPTTQDETEQVEEVKDEQVEEVKESENEEKVD